MRILIAGLFVIAFFSGSLIDYGVLPAPVAWLTEIFILIAFGLAIRSGRFNIPYAFPMAFCALTGIASAIVNGRFGIDVLMSLRLVFRFYFVFAAIVMWNPGERDLRWLNGLLFICFVLQIPAALVKFLYYGQGEAAIGLYSNTEGSLSTILPLIAIGFLFSYYAMWRKSKALILLIAAFVGFSFLGGKRGLVFFLPVMVMYAIALIYFVDVGSPKLRSMLRRNSALLALLVFIGVVFGGLKLIPTLNPEREVGGSVDIEHALDYAVEYTTQENALQRGYTGGRLATTLRIYEKSAEAGLGKVILGFGAGSYTESRFTQGRLSSGIARKFKIGYGLTPLGYMQIEYGLVGVVLMLSVFIGIVRRTLRSVKRLQPGYWGAFFFGLHLCAFNMTMLFVAYHQTSLLGDVVPLVFWYLVATGIVMDRRLAKAARISEGSPSVSSTVAESAK